MPLLTAQTPYEFFTLREITPPTVEYQNIIPPIVDAPKELFLDTNTDVGGNLSMTEPFAPPVGVYKRTHVLDTMTFRDHRIFFIQSPPQNCEIVHPSVPPHSHTTHRSAILYLKLSSELSRLPGDSPEMILTAFSAHPVNNSEDAHVNLYKCTDNDYFLSTNQPGIYQLEFETASPADAATPKPAEFFIGSTPQKIHLSQDLVSAVDSVVSHHDVLQQIHLSPNSLSELILFFQSFESESLSEDTLNLIHNNDPQNDDADQSSIWMDQNRMSAMIQEQKGICRHRSFIFAWIANSWGFPTRIVVNEVHAFVEIYHLGHWYPVELGGRANSLTITPTSQTKSTTVQQNFSFLQASTTNNSAKSFDSGTSNTRTPSNQQTNMGNYPAFIHPTNPYLLHSQAAPTRLRTGNFIFVPKSLPQHLFRDQNIEISGTMFDENRQPAKHQTFLFECSHESRVPYLLKEFTTDDNGQFTIWIKLPPDWPIGNSSLNWYIYQ